MKYSKSYIFFILPILIVFGCSQQKTPDIVGLWQVDRVNVADQIMTPIARWTRFNSDNTQVSGNGWFQHSRGTYNLNEESNTLEIFNTNGLEDLNPPFNVTFNEDSMVWKRTEEGQQIEVFLSKKESLPSTHGDKLLGLWQLDDCIGTGPFFNTQSKHKNDYLFFRWDKRAIINSSNGRVNAVYNTHGHKPELEIIPYPKEMDRSFWRMDVQEERLELRLLNSDSTITRQFVRIHNFPN